MSTRWHYIKEPFDDAEFYPESFSVIAKLGEDGWKQKLIFDEPRFVQFLACIADKDSTAIYTYTSHLSDTPVDVYNLTGPFDETEWLISECLDIKRAGDVINGRVRV